MSSYEEIKDFTINFLKNHSTQNNSAPTMQAICNTLNENNFKTPYQKEIILPTLQRIFQDKSKINELWEIFRNDYETNNTEEWERIKKEKRQKEIEITNLIISRKNNDSESLKTFFLSVCEDCGRKNKKMPTMRSLADFANHAGLTSPTKKTITSSTVQYILVDNKLIIEAYNKGLKELNPEMPDFHVDENENYDEVIRLINIYIKGRGFLSQEKPSVEDVTVHINKMGMRTSKRRGLFTPAIITKIINDQFINITNEWNKGKIEARQALGKSTNIADAIKEMCNEWGRGGSLFQPNLTQIAEYLFNEGFTTDKGTRIQATIITQLLFQNNINVREEWDAGWEIRKNKVQEQLWEEETNKISLSTNTTNATEQLTHQQVNQQVNQQAASQNLLNAQNFMRYNLKNVTIPGLSDALTTPCVTPDETIPIAPLSSASTPATQALYIKEADDLPASDSERSQGDSGPSNALPINELPNELPDVPFAASGSPPDYLLKWQSNSIEEDD